MYVLLEFWQKIMAIPIMNPLSWFMISGITNNLLIMKCTYYKIIKNFVCESITKEILKHYYNSMYVVLMHW